MSSNKDYLSTKYPWDSLISTKDLLKKLISEADETEKVDFKLTLDIQSSKKEKNELLIDLASIANSYSTENDNYGFLILGVHPDTKKIIGGDFKNEKIATHIDERMAKFLAPHIRFSIELFDLDDSKKWGAIIIRSGIEMPHVFVKDTNEFKIGEVWVRKGSHKCRADHTDFSRFFAMRTADLERNIVELETRLNIQERGFQNKINEIEKKLGEIGSIQEVPKQKKQKKKKTKEIKVTLPDPISESQDNEFKDTDLLSITRNVLPLKSPLKIAMTKFVKEGQDFLESDEIPWDLQINEENKDQALIIIEKIQTKFEDYYRSVLEILMFDNKKENISIVFDSIKLLSKYIHRYNVNYDALYLRYLPIVTILHIVSMSTIYRDDESFLKNIFLVSLLPEKRHEKKHPVVHSLFFVRRAQNVFDALNPDYPKTRWCDGVGTYLKQYLQKVLANYDEIQDPEALFYKGEFILSLTPIVCDLKNSATPQNSLGSYIFFGEANNIIREFLIDKRSLVDKIFDDLKRVSEIFDQYAPRYANKGLCWGNGFSGSMLEILYDDKSNKET